MRPMSGTGRLASSLALWIGITADIASFTSVARAALTECEKLQRVLQFFGDGTAFGSAVKFASSSQWYKMLQGGDGPWSNHVLMSEKGLYRKMETIMDRSLATGAKTGKGELYSTATRFLSEDMAQEMLVEGFRRMDSLSAGKRTDPGDLFTLRKDPEDPSKQMLRISFNVDRPIGMGFVMGKDQFSEPVRVEGIQRVTLVVRKTKSREDPRKDFFHVANFYPDAVGPGPR